MDPKYFFEVNDNADDIEYSSTPTRINDDVTSVYYDNTVKLNEKLNNNPEAKYIYGKFRNPVDAKWFSGRQLFVPENTIRATHIFQKTEVKENPLAPTDYIISENNKIIVKNKLQLVVSKYDFIHCGSQTKYISKYNLPDDILFKTNIYILQNIIPKYLNTNGSAVFNSFSYRNIFIEDFHFIFLLRMCFDRVIVFRTKHVIAIGFKKVPANILKIKDYATTNADIKPLNLFTIHNFKSLTLMWQKYFLSDNYEMYFKLVHKIFLENKTLLNLVIDTIDSDFSLFSLRKVQKNPKNISKYLSAGINEEEGTFLYNMIIEHKLKKIIEVGMANGISASYITSALKHQLSGILISIDPFQKTQWKSVGLELIKDIKTKTYHKLIEEKSFTALPMLLEKNKSQIDLIFVDGWHTFDYTLVDIFYSVFLLKVKGFLVVDDALHPGVASTLKYITSNYTMLKRIPSPRTFGAYQKISDDSRDWNFHKLF